MLTQQQLHNGLARPMDYTILCMEIGAILAQEWTQPHQQHAGLWPMRLARWLAMAQHNPP